MTIRRSLLTDHRCRLGGVVEHDLPVSHVQGIPVWSAGPTLPHAVLVCVIRSLTLGEIVLSKDVTMREMLAALEFEGVSIKEIGTVPRIKGTAQIDAPPRGLVNALSFKDGQSRLLSMQFDVERLCDQIAAALAHWQRLESGLAAAAEGRAPCGFACSATRCWVSFVERPRETRADATASDRATTASETITVETLARKWPRWLTSLVITLELLHSRRVRDPANTLPEFSEELFKELQREYEGDMLGRFSLHRFDIPSNDPGRALMAFRREIADARVSAHKLRTLAMESLPAETGDGTVDGKILWARAAIAFADQVTAKSPNLAMLFSDQFVDEMGMSFERRALAKALKKYKIRVVRWRKESDPHLNSSLCFPTQFRQRGRAAAGLNNPAFLLAIDV